MIPFFLLSLRLSGIKNIDIPVEFQFYKKTIKNDFNPDDFRIKAIYGENGSGKTAIITAMKILGDLINNENYLYDSVSQRNLLELINKKTQAGQIEVEYYVNTENHSAIYKYQVAFKVGKDYRVHLTGEKLEVKKGTNSQNRYITVYRVQDGELIEFCNDDLYKKHKETTQNLLSQRTFASFLPGFFDLNEKKASVEEMHILYLYIFSIRLFVYIDQADDHRKYVNKLLFTEFQGKNAEEIYEYAINADSMINIYDDEMISKEYLDSYKDGVARMCSFIQMFKTDLLDIEVETKDYGSGYKCSQIMKYKDYSIASEYESNGIKKLMKLFSSLDAACRGFIVFIDELDSNINDIYLNKIIEYFMKFGQGQLCFTAHNLSPMSVLQRNKLSISFISSIHTVHTWTRNGNQSPENAYRDGFIDDSPYNVDASDFLGILGGTDE